VATLTVCTMTSNAGDRLEAWSERVLEFADELVIFVDEASSDGTLAIARQVADRCAVFDHPAVNAQVMDRCARCATSDWILWLDDDEVMHRDFAAAVGDHLEDRWVTHLLLPYRWMIEADDSVRWIASYPWTPDPRLRMWRNIGSLFWHRGRPHSPFDVQGESRLLVGDELAIWHEDFLLRDRAARERKTGRYRRNNVGPSREEYYLWEEAAPLDLREFAVDAVIRPPLPVGAARAADPPPPPRPPPRGRGAAPHGPVERIGMAEIHASSARNRPDTDIFAAEYQSHDGPVTIRANQGANVTVRVRNTSAHVWRSSGLHPGRVELSYHWEHDAAGQILRTGDTAVLAGDVGPGEVAVIEAGVWAPYEPGRYTLVWDLRAAGFNWFSERGVAPYRVGIDVVAAGRRTGRPRTVAEIPARARPPAPGRLVSAGRWLRAAQDTFTGNRRIRASNLHPIEPQRLIDTRNGTGVPGVPTGPIAAGTTVEVDVGDQHCVPVGATAVVGTLSVLGATYNGWVSAVAGGSPARPVTCHFHHDGSPTSTAVVVALGRDEHAGRLALVLSDNWPGHAQLVLDATGYLA
jgi:hypothetical protein